MLTSRVFIPLPAIPANNATISLLTTKSKVISSTQFDPPAAVDGKRVVMVEVVFLKHNKASAANGLRVHAWDKVSPADANGAWMETDLKDDIGASTIGTLAPVQVPILAAGAEFRRSLYVGHLSHVSVEYTAGADNPEDWSGYIVVHFENPAVVR